MVCSFNYTVKTWWSVVSDSVLNNISVTHESRQQTICELLWKQKNKSNKTTKQLAIKTPLHTEIFPYNQMNMVDTFIQ